LFGFRRKVQREIATVAPAARVAPATETRSLASPEPWLLNLFAATPTQSGVVVSPTNAMQCTPVRAAVEAISEGIGGLPLHVYRREGEARQRATDHPAYGLLHDDANDWTPAGLFREQVTRDALLWGNGFAFINRHGGQPRELIRLAPSRVSVELDSQTSEPVYRLDGQVIDRRDVLHIQAPSVDGVKGTSPVLQCRDAIGLALTMQNHAARLFGRGGRPSGILKFPNKLGDASIAKMKASWQAAHAGENSGGTAVLEEGGEFQSLTMTSTDAQFLELWTLAVVEIARVFRVPPHMLFELGRATWGNAGEMGASFLRFTLDRWLKVWQGEIRLKLIDPEDRATFYAEFLLDDLLRTDLTARADAYGKLIAARVLNPNEVRAMENRAPYEGGDEFLNPNTTGTSRAAASSGGNPDE
jgi:HK97 family phage portal protein